MNNQERKQAAGEFSAALTTVDRKLSMYRIQEEIMELEALHEQACSNVMEAEAQLAAASQDERREYWREAARAARDSVAAIEHQIGEYLMREADKADAMYQYQRWLKDTTEAAKAEESRLRRIRNSAEAALDRMNSMLLGFLEIRGLKRCQGQLHHYRAQKNPADSVDIVDESKIPPRFRRLTIQVNAEAWSERILPSIDWDMDADYEVRGDEPVLSAIAQAAQGDCPTCEGDPIIDGGTGEVCAACSGTGKRVIPGAVVKRKNHLRWK